jgi:hypothetical protein
MSKGIEYSDELFVELCDRIAEGRSLRSVCSDADMPAKKSVFQWLATNPALSDQYARACEERAEYLAELALIEANNESTESGAVARDRLKVDTIKWFASKLAPKKYGDRSQVDHTNNGKEFQAQTVIIQSTGEAPEKT